MLKWVGKINYKTQTYFFTTPLYAKPAHDSRSRPTLKGICANHGYMRSVIPLGITLTIRESFIDRGYRDGFPYFPTFQGYVFYILLICLNFSIGKKAKMQLGDASPKAKALWGESHSPLYKCRPVGEVTTSPNPYRKDCLVNKINLCILNKLVFILSKIAGLLKTYPCQYFPTP